MRVWAILHVVASVSSSNVPDPDLDPCPFGDAGPPAFWNDSVVCGNIDSERRWNRRSLAGTLTRVLLRVHVFVLCFSYVINRGGAGVFVCCRCPNNGRVQTRNIFTPSTCYTPCLLLAWLLLLTSCHCCVALPLLLLLPLQLALRRRLFSREAASVISSAPSKQNSMAPPIWLPLMLRFAPPPLRSYRLAFAPIADPVADKNARAISDRQ